MNSWQINFINQNLPKLIEVTSCTETLIALLISKGLLSDEEVQVLKMEGRNYGGIRAASGLYSILKSRTKGFFGLMEALQETQQTGAWNIFRSGIQQKLSTFPVKLASDVVPLNELFTAWTKEDSVKCLDSSDTMREFCHLLANDTEMLDIDKAFLSTNPHLLYIPRFVSNRVLVNVSAFTQACADVFVFKGIDKYDLAELVDPSPVRSSSDQLTLITCRHIYLEDDEDWDDLRDVTKSPLHLINKEEGEYSLQRSTQITDTILSHSSSRHRPTEAYISEDEFAKGILENRDTKGICVCDIPGMGKTWFLESVATKLQILSERTLVPFVQLSGFTKSLGGLSESPRDPLSYIIEVSCSSKLVSYVLRSQGTRSDLNIILILDGFDEIRQDCVEKATKFLKELICLDNIQLLISSRPRMRKHLEETFKVISYDILPFGREEQVNAIVGHWQLSFQDNEAQLREHAEECIRVVKTIQCRESKNILGVPLICFILAEVNFKQAQQIARRKKRIKVAEEAVISSICDLYEMFVESRISKVVEPNSGDMKKKIQAFHTLQALNLLMPTELPGCLDRYLNISNEKSSITEEIAVEIGILSYDSKSQLMFLHRSFAEYLVGIFFADFWKNLADFDDRLVRSVGHYFVKHLLEISTHNYLAGLVQVKFHIMWYSQHVSKEKVSFFTNRRVLWFMNCRCQNETKVVSRLREALVSRTSTTGTNTDEDKDNIFSDFKNMLKTEVFVILITCIDEQFRYILSLFLQIFQVFFEYSELPPMLSLPDSYREMSLGRVNISRKSKLHSNKSEAYITLLLNCIAASGFPEIAHEIFKTFPNSQGNYLLQFCANFPINFFSPLEISIVRNNTDMFAYLFKKVNLPVERLVLSCLLGRIVTPTDISKRVEIFGRILAVNKDKLWTGTTENLREYLETNLIMEGRSKFQWIAFAFHHNLSLYEMPRSNKVHILHVTLDEVGDVEMFQLLHLLFGKSGNLSCTRREKGFLCEFPFKAEETLQSLDLSEAKDAFALISSWNLYSFRPYPYLGTVQNLETLKVLLCVYPNIKERTNHGVNYLHVAAQKGAIDWIEYLVKEGHSVDEKNKKDMTPMLHVSETNCIGVINALIANGANINAVNNKQQNIAHWLLREKDLSSLKVVTEFVDYTLEKGYYQLWTVKDEQGTTAFELLSKCVGETHSLAKTVHSKLQLTNCEGQT